MPTYEYACKFCGKHLEIFQPITADALKRCPACHKQGLKRLISGGAGLIFKGTGFYETDYKRPDNTAQNAAKKKPVESKSTEAKPAESKSADAKPKAEPAKTAPAKTSKP
jgi:putative FmdB family regulatory protein